jgi:hypothetical protein
MPGSLRTPATFILVWLVTGGGAVAGSILGAALGKPTLFVGAVLGGLLGSVFSVWIVKHLGWLSSREHRLATLGSMIGFFVAAPIAGLNLDGPVIPVLATALAGIGAVIGAKLAPYR